MQDILLIVCFLVEVIFGFFLMAKLDHFLGNHRNAIAKEKQKKRPYGIVSNTATKEDPLSETETFRRNHSCAYVAVCDPTEADDIDLCEAHPVETTEKEVHTNEKATNG